MSRKTFRQLLARSEPVLMPVVTDALSARIVRRAGFDAFAIGGFPLVGSRYGIPDIGLASFGEMAEGVRDLLGACDLPCLVDSDDGYGDVKNVTRTVRTYESLGAAGVVLEDQVAPKRCGHMAGKDVTDAEPWLAKLRAALAARNSPDLFVMARTDARATRGLDEALRRGEAAFAAGVDGVFIEAPQSIEELEKIGRTFKGKPLLANMLEDGKTPWLEPAELKRLGFAMVVYPTTIAFHVARAIEETLADLKHGKRPKGGATSFEEFKAIVGFGDWAEIENRFGTPRR